MRIEEALSGALNAALSTANAYPHVASQNAAMPFVVYKRVSDVRIHAMGVDPNINNPLFRISSFSTSYALARVVAGKVRSTLQDYQGMLSGTTGVNVQRIFWDDEYENTVMDPETGNPVFEVAQDFIIWHTT